MGHIQSFSGMSYKLAQFIRVVEHANICFVPQSCAINYTINFAKATKIKKALKKVKSPAQHTNLGLPQENIIVLIIIRQRS